MIMKDIVQLVLMNFVGIGTFAYGGVWSVKNEAASKADSGAGDLEVTIGGTIPLMKQPARNSQQAPSVPSWGGDNQDNQYNAPNSGFGGAGGVNQFSSEVPNQKMQYGQQLPAPLPVVASIVSHQPNNSAGSSNMGDRIQKLADLMKQGLISQDEFDVGKKTILQM